MAFSQLPLYFLISQAAAAAFAAARLLHFSLWRRFPFLFSYLLAKSIYDAVLSVLPDGSQAYLWVYLIGSPIFCVVGALSIYEMFTLIFREYPGLRTAGRWALNAALAISVTVSILILKKPWPGESPNTRRLFYELTFDHSIYFGLAVIIVIQLIFLSRYPLHLDRNTYVSSGFFSAMFLAQSVIRLIDILSPRLFLHYADYSEVAFSATCLLGWGLFLGPANAPARAPVAVNKPRETELLQQLESLNKILSRTGRR